MKNYKFKKSVVLYLVIFTVVSGCSRDDYRDYLEKQRKESFYENIDAFQKLEKMQREDLNVVQDISIFDQTPQKYALSPQSGKVEKMPIQGVSQERWDEYLRLLKQVDVEYLGYVQDEADKRMVRFGDFSNLNHGYVYMEYPPPRFYNSRKECIPIMPSRSCYIYLAQNWYIYSEKFRLLQN